MFDGVEMMHVTYDGKSVLMDDDAATLLLQYAAEVGRHRTADVVNVAVVNTDGNALTVTYLLNGSSELTAETTTSELPAPANDEAVSYMRDRIGALQNPPLVQPEDDVDPPAPDPEL